MYGIAAIVASCGVAAGLSDLNAWEDVTAGTTSDTPYREAAFVRYDA